MKKVIIHKEAVYTRWFAWFPIYIWDGEKRFKVWCEWVERKKHHSMRDDVYYYTYRFPVVYNETRAAQ